MSIDGEKNDRFFLETYNAFIAGFLDLNNFIYSWFFDKTFLLSNISKKLLFAIYFLTFNNINIQFTKKKLF